MKHSLAMGAATLCLVTTALAGDWLVLDDSKQTVFAVGAGDGGNHTFRNSGADGSIVVNVFNSSGTLIQVVELGYGSDVVINIPRGGGAEVEDLDDSDAQGAYGNYT